jgi:hypothetical protein
MLRWKSSLKPAAAAPATDITLEDSAVTTGVDFSAPTDIDVNIPAVSIDDILLLLCTSDGASNPIASPPAGWTKIAEQDGASASHSTVAAYWKRASSSASATTETWSSFYPDSEAYYIWVGAYSGCVTSGSPVDAYGGAAVGFSTPWSANVTTTTADTMIVTVSGSTNSTVTHTWSDGTELIDTVYPGTNATVSINEKLEATAGSKTRTVTPSITTSNAMIAVALKPAGAADDYSSTVLADSPTAYWQLDESSGTTLADYTGSYDLTLSGSYSLNQPTLAGSSASVDFTSGFAEGANQGPNLSSTDYTLELVTKLDSTQLDWAGLISSGDSGNNWAVQQNSGTGQLRIYHGTGHVNFIGGWSSIADNSSHHIVLTYINSSKTMELWIDGVSQGTKTHSKQPANNAGFTLRLAAPRNGTVPATGIFDEAAIYTSKLSDARISAHYDAYAAP